MGFIDDFSGLTEEYKFYNDEVTLRYDPKDHVYLLLTEEGQLEPQEGVTTICHIIDKSNALIPWACKMMYQKLMYLTEQYVIAPGELVIPLDTFEKLAAEAKKAHKDKLEEAADVGHQAHAWIERYIMGKNPSQEGLDTRVESCVLAALTWMKAHNVKWIRTECKIYSRTYRYAGTLDGIALCSSCNNPLCCPEHFEDRLSLVDWKSSNNLYPEYVLQTAAYQHAYQEEHGVEIQDRWIIRLGKVDAKFDPWHLPNGFESDFKAFLHCLELSRAMNDLTERLKQVKKSKKPPKSKKTVDKQV